MCGNQIFNFGKICSRKWDIQVYLSESNLHLRPTKNTAPFVISKSIQLIFGHLVLCFFFPWNLSRDPTYPIIRLTYCFLTTLKLETFFAGWNLLRNLKLRLRCLTKIVFFQLPTVYHLCLQRASFIQIPVNRTQIYFYFQEKNAKLVGYDDFISVVCRHSWFNSQYHVIFTWIIFKANFAVKLYLNVR